MKKTLLGFALAVAGAGWAADGAAGEPQFHEKGEGMERRLAVKAMHTGHSGWGAMRVDAPARTGRILTFLRVY